MFYCPDKGVIFIHIPKSAGSSIRTALAQGLYGTKDIKEYERGIVLDIDKGTKFHQRAHGGHAPASLIRAHDYLAFDSSFTFSVVRNPFDRIVSMWRFALQAKATGKNPDKRVFLALQHRGFNRQQCRRVRERLMGAPLIDWLHFCDENLWNGFPSWSGCVMKSPERPYTRIQQIEWLDAPIDIVFRIEDRDEIQGMLDRWFGGKIKLGHVNKSERAKDYRQYYCREARRYVEEAFKDDIERFGYEY